MRRVIVTGATGVLGTALINRLVSERTEVLVFSSKNSTRNKNIIRHPLVKIKYCDLSEFSTIENDTGVTYDVFYHFAWAGTTGIGRNDMYMQNMNVQYALDAVAMAKKFGCHTFIGAGSQAEYGRVEGRLTASTPTFPETGYGYAKLCAGLMTRDFAHQLGLKHLWVRILSIYGINDGEQSMVMSTVNNLLKGITPRFTKGEQMWDYLFSEDAAEAFFRLGDKGIDGKTYVLGSGNVMPLAEYIKIIRDTVAPKAKIELGAIPYAPKQIMYLCADISELSKDTGWKPKTDFVTGISKILGI